MDEHKIKHTTKNNYSLKRQPANRNCWKSRSSNAQPCMKRVRKPPVFARLWNVKTPSVEPSYNARNDACNKKKRPLSVKLKRLNNVSTGLQHVNAAWKRPAKRRKG